jgi:iron-sulfur cluster assembly protein
MLTLTEEAKDVVRAMVAAGADDGSTGLRIATEDGDGGGLSLSLASDPSDGDAVIDEDGTRIFIEPEAAEMLDDKVLDAQRHEDHVHFSLHQQGGLDGAGPTAS